MKTSTVSLTVWFAQVLSLCALHENHTDPPTTPKLDISTTTSQAITIIKTTVISAKGMMSDGTPHQTPTKLSGSTSSLEDDRRNTISTSDHNIMSLTEITISTKTTNEYDKTGTSPESTSRNIQNMTEILTSSIQLDHNTKTTTTSWTENRTRETDEENVTTDQLPLIYSTHQTDVTQTAGSYGKTDTSPAPSTAGTYLEIISTKQTPTDVTTNTTTPAETSGHISIPVTLVHSTEMPSSSTVNTEEPMVPTTEMMAWRTEENTDALATTLGNVYNNTRNTSSTMRRNIFTSETETPAGTSGTFNTTSTPDQSTQAVMSRHHSTEEMYSTGNTEEPLLSTTKIIDWKTQETTAALTTTQGTTHNDMTNTTWGAWPSNTEDSWSTNSTMPRNMAGTETPVWRNCLSRDSSSKHRQFSSLVCFITLWSLAMIASIFLGLTVFLWVRLSVTKKRARLRGRGRRDRTAKEKDSLWVEPDSSNEERVEFWYANGTTVEENKKRKGSRREKTRKNKEEQMDMWIQPKVTMKDITEFWYANGRVRHDEETPCELNQEE